MTVLLSRRRRRDGDAVPVGTGDRYFSADYFGAGYFDAGFWA